MSTYGDDQDGTQFLVRIELPSGRVLRCRDLHPHVYGLHLDHGAKPWPYYRDAQTGEWWSLSTPSDVPLDAALWKIDLVQLAYHRSTAEQWMRGVLEDLEAAAAKLGARSVPEGSVANALEKMERAVALHSIRQASLGILVVARSREGHTVDEWWRALEQAGFVWGDGDLFWLRLGTGELCAEPFTRSGYFHPGDRASGRVRFPDVQLHIRLANIIGDPHGALTRASEIAATVANTLGAQLTTTAGDAWSAPTARATLDAQVARLRALTSA